MKTTKKWARKKTCISSSEKYREADEKENGEGQGIQYVHCLQQKKIVLQESQVLETTGKK